jgi:hypothetical protein
MLITLDEAKEYLGIPLSDESQDAFLTMEIKVLSEAIEGYCGRKFLEDDYTQTFYWEDFRDSPVKDLPLYHYPVTDIDSVEENGVEMDSDLYRLRKASGILVASYGNTFFREQGEIVVSYSAGYEEAPAPVLSVIYGLLTERYNKKVNGVGLSFGSDVQQISIPGVINVAFDYSLQANERKSAFGTILGNYINVLDSYCSERVVVGSMKGSDYVE